MRHRGCQIRISGFARPSDHFIVLRPSYTGMITCNVCCGGHRSFLRGPGIWKPFSKHTRSPVIPALRDAVQGRMLWLRRSAAETPRKPVTYEGGKRGLPGDRVAEPFGFADYSILLFTAAIITSHKETKNYIEF